MSTAAIARAAAAAPADAGWTPDFSRLDAALAQRWRAVLLRRGSQAVLAAAGDCQPALLQAAERLAGEPLGWRTVPEAAMAAWLQAGETGLRALDLVAGGPAVGGDDDGPADGAHELSAASLRESASPVVQLLDATLFDALQQGASDIHVEADEQGARVLLRIDGVLQRALQVPGVRAAEQLVSRLKVMAELDIGERRVPQDGRFRLRLQGREVDFRLSVIPSIHGEDVVLRVLDRSQLERQHGALSLAALGLAEGLRSRLLAQAAQPHGLLLVTGPTGSGKTTTLYALLQDTRRPGEKTITIEDPVEYRLADTTQIPVHERKGLGFARGLRAVLRHDPDRILVGEIRDAETAGIAVQAAQTGHIVLSSLHANGVFDGVGRLAQLGLAPHQVVSALNAVLAQRLLRQVCGDCREPFEPPPARRAALARRLAQGSGPDAGAGAGAGADAGGPWYRGRGCPACHGSGLRGRRAVAELLVLDDALRDAIAAQAPLSALKQAAQSGGWVPLQRAALDELRAGRSTWEEVERVTGPIPD